MNTHPFEWHARRRAAILRAHPELGELQRHDARSAVLVVALLALQIGAAAALRHASWALVIGLGLALGAFPSKVLALMLHECSHNLVARTTRANKLWSLVANIPLFAPAAIVFRYQHALHHRRVGEGAPNDPHAPTDFETRIANRTHIVKVIWWVFGPFVPPSLRRLPMPPMDAWNIANTVVQIVATALLAVAFGPRAMAYLGASVIAAFQLHPIATRRYGEHMVLDPEQPTNSYYGPLNWLTIFVGYHVEHHDLPRVPWTALRHVTRLAPEFYRDLRASPGWCTLWWRLFFDSTARADDYVRIAAPAEATTDHPANSLPDGLPASR